MMKRAMFVARVTFVMLLIAFACGCSGKGDTTKGLSAAYIENASCWPFFVAQELGLFEKTGVKVEAVKAGDSSEALNALLAGKVDVAVENTYSALFAIESKSAGSIRLLIPCSETEKRFVSHLLVTSESAIKTPQELLGKRIGTYTGSTQFLTLKLFIQEYLKCDPDKDVQIVQVSPNLQVQALTAGQYDALFTIEPFASAALAKGIARDLLPYARGKILDPFPAGATSVSPEALSTKRQAIRMFYEAMVRGAEFIQRNPEEARRILAKWTNLDPETAEHVGGYEYYTLEQFDAEECDRVQKLADLYLKGEIITSPISARRMFLTKEEL